MDQRLVRGGGVGAAHRAQHRVVAMLQRQVEVRREPGRRCHELHDLGRAVHRLERADAEQHVGRPFAEAAQQRRQRRAVAQVTPVRTQVHAAQRDLAVAGGDRGVDGTQHPVDRARLPGAARRGNDAVAARLVAARLHAQREGRAARHAGLHRRTAGSVRSGIPRRGGPEPSPRARAPGPCRGLGTTRTTPGRSRQIGRLPRRVASRHDDSRGGILAGDPADGLARTLVRSAR